MKALKVAPEFAEGAAQTDTRALYVQFVAHELDRTSSRGTDGDMIGEAIDFEQNFLPARIASLVLRFGGGNNVGMVDSLEDSFFVPGAA